MQEIGFGFIGGVSGDVVWKGESAYRVGMPDALRKPAGEFFPACGC